MTPRVSVVIATRDRLASLRRTLDSVDAQTFRDFELLVVDDGSRDGTAGWLRATRPEALVASAAGVGAAAARNLAVARAGGEYVAFLDDDDAWRPAYLESQVAQLDANAGTALSWAGHVEVDPAGRESRPETRSLLDDPAPLVRMLAEPYIHTMSVVACRREAFERFGLLDERLRIVHDLDWYARVLAGGGALAHLPGELVERSAPGRLTAAHRRWFAEERSVLTRTTTANGDARLIRAYRSLFFARIALGKGDVPFGLARLGEALAASPRSTVRLAARRLRRNAEAAC